MSQLKEAALAFARAGRKIFPCKPGSKDPATAHGFHDATSDPAQIEAWWNEEPEYNIAWQPQTEGLAVLDIDGEEGEAAYAVLEIERGALPETLELGTPRGRHLYFVGELPPSVSKLGDHIDTRGGGSYVLLPPSRTEHGEYRTLRFVEPAPLPAWVPAYLASLKKTKLAAVTDDLDQPQNVSRAREWLRLQKPAIEGQGGDAHTYATACGLLNIGLSEEKALELLLDEWNERCDPPWEPDELAVKVANAAAYAENAPGSWAVNPLAETFADALGKLPAEAPPGDDPFKQWHTIGSLLDTPEPQWLVPEAILEEGTVLLYGPPKSFKTFAALEWSLTLAAAGRMVAYVAGEGARDVAKRAKAWCIARDVEPDALALRIFPVMPPLGASEEKRIEFAKSLLDTGIDPALIVLDTAAKAMRGLNENDARDAGLFVDVVDDLKRTFRAAVLVIHHSGKDDDGPRGSIVFTADFDTVHKVSREGDRETPIISIMNTAQRTAAEREYPWRLKGDVIGQELVFAPMSDAEYAQRKREADPYSGPKVGAALAQFKGAEVTTHVLATEMAGFFDDPDRQAKAVAGIARGLVSRAKTSLAGYCKGAGNPLMWALPVVSLDKP